MAELSKKEPLALRVFRRTGKVVLETPEGETAEGRGVISALRKETGEPGGVRHSLGVLGRPLYRFTGWLPQPVQKGTTLLQTGERYTVLDVRSLRLGERELGVRALLERRKGDDVDTAAGRPSDAV